jgi:hypothetical protein
MMDIIDLLLTCFEKHITSSSEIENIDREHGSMVIDEGD